VPALVLASSSPYRRELLTRIVSDFEALAPRVDETLGPDEHPRDAVLRLARAKATAVAVRRPDAVILAGDQLAGLDDRPIGKPLDDADARRMLAKLSGRTISYYTAVALLSAGSREPHIHLDVGRVFLRTLDEAEIERYVAAESPLDCAGALKLEGLGIALCARIETTDPTGLIGLPLIATARLLAHALGIRIP
jgi:7-methyl-GTP pyrophosphatase